MTKYIYAVAAGNWAVQHLLETLDQPALCGLTLDRNRWHVGAIARRAFPGVPLCEDCRQRRETRKAVAGAKEADARAAVLREQAAAIKTFWVQERTP